MIGNIYITGVLGEETNLIDIIGQVQKQPEALSFNVNINSPGGYVHIGYDIYNYLKTLGKPLTTIGNGMVASAATIPFMAGQIRKVVSGTKFMIHLPWLDSVSGNSSELEYYLDDLKKTEKELLSFYTKQLGLQDEAIQPLVRDETWLTEDQLLSLGFTTEQPTQVVALAYYREKEETKININNKSMTNEDKSFLQGLFDKFAKNFTKSKALVIQDATGMEINFPDLADGETITTGATATVDGAPAEGEYLLPDGSTYVFAAGVLTDIIPAATNELDAANQRIAELEAENASLVARAEEAEAVNENIKKEFKNFKAQVTSKLNIDAKKEPSKNPVSKPDEDRTEQIKSLLKRKKQ